MLLIQLYLIDYQRNIVAKISQEQREDQCTRVMMTPKHEGK